MGSGEDLGIYSDIPFLQRILKFISKVIWILFLNPRSSYIFDLIVVILVVLIVSSKLRFYLDNTLLSAGIFIILFIFCIVLGYLLSVFIFPRFQRLLLGGPVFGKVGGPDRKSFFTALKCVDAIAFKFEGKDLEKITEFNKLDTEITEELLKSMYRQNLYKKHDQIDSADFESKWSKIWNEKILPINTGGISFRDVLSEEKFASRFVPTRMLVSTSFVTALVNVFQLIMIYLVFSLINESIKALTVIQVGVFLCFILSIIWIIYNSYPITEIPLGINYHMLPERIKKKFSDRVKPFLGKTVVPKKIIVKNRYFSLMRNYQARQTSVAFLNSVLVLTLVGIVLIMGVLWSPTNVGRMISWYEYFSIGVILLPFAFIIGFYLTSIIIQNFRQVIAPIILALLTVVSPFAFIYLFTGHFEFIEVKNAVLGFIGGLSVLLSTAILKLADRGVQKEED